MHIGRVSHVFYPDVVGDPFNSYQLSLRQIKLGHRISVFTWSKNGSQRSENIDDNFLIRRLYGINLGIGKCLTEFPYVPSLRKVIREEKPDLIHAHSHLFLTTYDAITESFSLGKPSVVTIHGYFVERNKIINLLQRFYLKTIVKEIFKRADKVIFLTHYDAKEGIKNGCPMNKVEIVPNAVDTNLFKPRPEYEEDGLILWVGRFVPEKGLRFLIDAARMVLQRHKDAKFVLAGGGPLRSQISRLISHYNLDGKIMILGTLTKEEVSSLLARASIYVLPSLQEGFPKALLEAMASGKAVIASKITGLDEIIENNRNGILVPPSNSASLANSITNLLEDKNLRQKLGDEARKDTVRFYSWDVVLQQIERVYEEAVLEVNRK